MPLLQNRKATGALLQITLAHLSTSCWLSSWCQVIVRSDTLTAMLKAQRLASKHKDALPAAL